ncbi:putative Serine/threonine-protein kinase ATR [Paratrimastix pyriformis]|uniref:non-specific serine/threonine protein kinase n=1 Tax=Paratrimastix pyriformis TaxID=342808 RepID=A0ABQ8UF64_9EUKA|nr:putative Serine/threonine-protein kinase ATR [Paratrimastix pyriformis]
MDQAVLQEFADHVNTSSPLAFDLLPRLFSNFYEHQETGWAREVILYAVQNDPALLCDGDLHIMQLSITALLQLVTSSSPAEIEKSSVVFFGIIRFIIARAAEAETPRITQALARDLITLISDLHSLLLLPGLSDSLRCLNRTDPAGFAAQLEADVPLFLRCFTHFVGLAPSTPTPPQTAAVIDRWHALMGCTTNEPYIILRTVGDLFAVHRLALRMLGALLRQGVPGHVAWQGDEADPSEAICWDGLAAMVRKHMDPRIPLVQEAVVEFLHLLLIGASADGPTTESHSATQESQADLSSLGRFFSGPPLVPPLPAAASLLLDLTRLAVAAAEADDLAKQTRLVELVYHLAGTLPLQPAAAPCPAAAPLAEAWAALGHRLTSDRTPAYVPGPTTPAPGPTGSLPLEMPSVGQKRPSPGDDGSLKEDPRKRERLDPAEDGTSSPTAAFGGMLEPPGREDSTQLLIAAAGSVLRWASLSDPGCFTPSMISMEFDLLASPALHEPVLRNLAVATPAVCDLLRRRLCAAPPGPAGSSPTSRSALTLLGLTRLCISLPRGVLTEPTATAGPPLLEGLVGALEAALLGWERDIAKAEVGLPLLHALVRVFGRLPSEALPAAFVGHAFGLAERLLTREQPVEAPMRLSALTLAALMAGSGQVGPLAAGLLLDTLRGDLQTLGAPSAAPLGTEATAPPCELVRELAYGTQALVLALQQWSASIARGSTEQLATSIPVAQKLRGLFAALVGHLFGSGDFAHRNPSRALLIEALAVSLGPLCCLINDIEMRALGCQCAATHVRRPLLDAAFVTTPTYPLVAALFGSRPAADGQPAPAGVSLEDPCCFQAPAAATATPSPSAAVILGLSDVNLTCHWCAFRERFLSGHDYLSVPRAPDGWDWPAREGSDSLPSAFVSEEVAAAWRWVVQPPPQFSPGDPLAEFSARFLFVQRSLLPLLRHATNEEIAQNRRLVAELLALLTHPNIRLAKWAATLLLPFFLESRDSATFIGAPPSLGASAGWLVALDSLPSKPAEIAALRSWVAAEQPNQGPLRAKRHRWARVLRRASIVPGRRTCLATLAISSPSPRSPAGLALASFIPLGRLLAVDSSPLGLLWEQPDEASPPAAAAPSGVEWLRLRCNEIMDPLRQTLECSEVPPEAERPSSPPPSPGPAPDPSALRSPLPSPPDTAGGALGEVTLLNPRWTLEAMMHGLGRLGLVMMAQLQRRAQVRAQSLRACLPRTRSGQTDFPLAIGGRHGGLAESAAGSTIADDWMGFECEVETEAFGAAADLDDEEEQEEEEEEEQQERDGGFRLSAEKPAAGPQPATPWMRGSGTCVALPPFLESALYPCVMSLRETRAYYDAITQFVLLSFTWRLSDTRPLIQNLAHSTLTQFAQVRGLRLRALFEPIEEYLARDVIKTFYRKALPSFRAVLHRLRSPARASSGSSASASNTQASLGFTSRTSFLHAAGSQVMELPLRTNLDEVALFIYGTTRRGYLSRWQLVLADLFFDIPAIARKHQIGAQMLLAIHSVTSKHFLEEARVPAPWEIVAGHLHGLYYTAVVNEREEALNDLLRSYKLDLTALSKENFSALIVEKLGDPDSDVVRHTHRVLTAFSLRWLFYLRERHGPQTPPSPSWYSPSPTYPHQDGDHPPPLSAAFQQAAVRFFLQERFLDIMSRMSHKLKRRFLHEKLAALRALNELILMIYPPCRPSNEIPPLSIISPPTRTSSDPGGHEAADEALLSWNEFHDASIPKILAILRFATTDPNPSPLVVRLGCLVLATFVKRLGPAHLAPYLSQIIGDLFPILSTYSVLLCGSPIRQIVHHFLIEGHSSIREYIHQIPWLFPIESSAAGRGTESRDARRGGLIAITNRPAPRPIRDTLLSFHALTPAPPPEELYERAVRGMRDSSPNVRFLSLVQLRTVIRLRPDLVMSTNASGADSPVNSALLLGLLRLCADRASVDVRLAAGQCFAELGAIDPRLVPPPRKALLPKAAAATPRPNEPDGTGLASQPERTNSALVTSLIDVLLPEYQGASDHDDRAALAIQVPPPPATVQTAPPQSVSLLPKELLKVPLVPGPPAAPLDPSGPGASSSAPPSPTPVFSQLSTDVRRYVLLLRTSRYKAPARGITRSLSKSRSPTTRTRRGVRGRRAAVPTGEEDSAGPAAPPATSEAVPPTQPRFESASGQAPSSASASVSPMEPTHRQWLYQWTLRAVEKALDLTQPLEAAFAELTDQANRDELPLTAHPTWAPHDLCALQLLACRGPIFRALHHILDHEELSLRLLPYALQSILCLGTQEEIERFVAAEMRSVMALASLYLNGNQAPPEAPTPLRVSLSSPRPASPQGRPGGEDALQPAPATPAVPVQSHKQGQIILSAQAVFGLLDLFSGWVQDRADRRAKELKAARAAAKLGPAAAAPSPPAIAPREDSIETAMRRVASCIPPTDLMTAALASGAHAHALLYLETNLRALCPDYKPMDSKSRYPFTSDNLRALQQIYAGLEESDGLAGVAALRPMPPTLDEQIIDSEASGDWAVALRCHELLAHSSLVRSPDLRSPLPPACLAHQLGILRCLGGMGQWDMLLAQHRAFASRAEPTLQPLHTEALEAAWRLSRWERVGSLLEEGGWKLEGDDPRVARAQAFLALSRREAAPFWTFLEQFRRALVPHLAAAAMTSYRRAYPHLVQLHIARELEQGCQWLAALSRHLSSGGAQLPPLPSAQLADWSPRLKRTQGSVATREPILAARRAVLDLGRHWVNQVLAGTARTDSGGQLPSEPPRRLLGDIEELLVDTWVSLARTARRTDRFEAATNALLHAQSLTTLGPLGAEGPLAGTDEEKRRGRQWIRVVLEGFKMEWRRGNRSSVTLQQFDGIAEQIMNTIPAEHRPVDPLGLGGLGGPSRSPTPEHRRTTRSHATTAALQEALLAPTPGPPAPSGVAASPGAWGQLVGMLSLEEKSKIMRFVCQCFYETSYKALDGLVETLVYLRPDEKSFFHLARWYDRLGEGLLKKLEVEIPPEPAAKHRRAGRDRPERQEPQVALLRLHTHRALMAYAKCLSAGADSASRHQEVAISRILSLWLRASAENRATTAESPLNPAPVPSPTPSGKRHITRVGQGGLGSLALRPILNAVPTKLLYPVLPQLVAWLHHPDPEVADILVETIGRILSAYPRYAYWAFLIAMEPPTLDLPTTHGAQLQFRQLHESRLQMISDRLTAASSPAKSRRHGAPNPTPAKAGALPRGWQEAIQIREFLLKLCTPFEKDVNLRRTKLTDPLFGGGIQELPRDVSLVIPDQHALQNVVEDGTPSPHPALASFSPDVEILGSMQKPRKIAMLDGSGLGHIFLAKPNDDLRQDQRLMEYCFLVNKLLRRDSNTRDRNLVLRTYAVIPVSPKAGFLEWMPNLESLRGILGRFYPSAKHEQWRTQFNNEICPHQLNPEKRALCRSEFELLLRDVPPVLHKLFKTDFPSPDAWFEARRTFTRLTAAWSMVGYVLGLGDRHTDNILIDCTTGACIHIDFGMLFDRGRSLRYPEVVPFRLTHNMIDAFGITGVEGSFRRTCEEVMRVLREHREALTSVWDAYLHDPYLELQSKLEHQQVWSCIRPQSRAFFQYSPEANVKLMDDRLSGFWEGLRLNTAGQVQSLTEAATSLDNLSLMYHGWCPWL